MVDAVDEANTATGNTNTVFDISASTTINGGTETNFTHLLADESNSQVSITNQNLTVDDGTISVDNANLLTATTSGVVTATIATTETVIEPPKEKRVDQRSKRRPKTGDGKAAEQLKNFIGGFGNFLMEYPSDVFATEIESIKQFGEAIEERKKEVKKRPKTRKR